MDGYNIALKQNKHGTPTDSLQDQGTKQPGIQKSQSFIYMGSLNWIISGLF